MNQGPIWDTHRLTNTNKPGKSQFLPKFQLLKLTISQGTFNGFLRVFLVFVMIQSGSSLLRYVLGCHTQRCPIASQYILTDTLFPTARAMRDIDGVCTFDQLVGV